MVQIKIFLLLTFHTVIFSFELDSTLQKILNLNSIQKYDEALYNIQLFSEKKPESPFPHILQAYTELLKSYDCSCFIDKQKLEEILEIGINKAEDLYKLNSDNEIAYFYLGLAYGAYSSFSGIDGNLILAAVDGIKSKMYFEKYLEFNNSDHDSQIAVATFNLWELKTLPFLENFPFWGNSKSEAVEIIETNFLDSKFNFHSAFISLFWSYLDDKDYKKLEDLLELVLKKYPHNRIYKSYLARIYYDSNPEKAIIYYSELLDLYKKQGKFYLNKILDIRRIIGELYNKLNQSQDVQNQINLGIEDYNNFDYRDKNTKILKQKLIDLRN